MNFVKNSPFQTLFLFLTFTCAILSLLSDSGVVAVEAATSSGSSEVDGDVMCPTLYFHEIKVLDSVTKEEKNEPSSVGEKVLLVCEKDISGDKVFPASQRTCLQNGKWSSHDVIPSCVDLEPEYEPLNSVENYCVAGKSIDCNQLFKKWKEVGTTLNSSGIQHASNHEINIRDNNGHEIQEILHRFGNRYFLSFMTFKVPLDSNGYQKNYSVTIFAPPEDVLDEANSTLLWKHYDLFRQHNLGSKENTSNAVVNIGTYVKQVLIRFTTSKEKDYDAKYNSTIFKYSWNPDANFFPLIKPKPYDECPKEPTIANATVSGGSRRSVTYKCQEGCDMLDVFSGQNLHSGTIECLDGNWELRPFPVCRNAHKKAQRDNLDAEKKRGMRNFGDNPFQTPKSLPNAEVSEHPVVDNSQETNVKETADVPDEKETKSDYLIFLLTAVSLLAIGLLSGITIMVICNLLRKGLNFMKSERSPTSDFDSKPSITRFFSAGKYSVILEGKSEDGSRRSLPYCNKIPGALEHYYDYPIMANYTIV